MSHSLQKKLDSATLINYECQLKNVREVQSLSSFLNYLENRFVALQFAGAKKESNSHSIRILVLTNRKNLKNRRLKKVINCFVRHSELSFHKRRATIIRFRPRAHKLADQTKAMFDYADDATVKIVYKQYTAAKFRRLGSCVR